MKIFFIQIGLIFTCFFAHAQKDSIVFFEHIDTVEVRSFRKEISRVIYLENTSYSGLNLGAKLDTESAIFIKNYGPGTLATPTMRGMAANHTAILWKGFNIQSNMNGVFDFSLIPTVFVDDIALQYGGGSALWGSGAIGGTIHLTERKAFGEAGWTGHIGLSLGSFSDYQVEHKAKFVWNEGRTYVKWAAFYHQAENDFPYTDIAAFGKPRKRLENAALEQMGGLVEIAHRVKDWEISAWAWRQESDRLIPPSMTEANNGASQEDDIWRLGLGAKRIFSDKVLNIKTAWFEERIYFENRAISSDSKAGTYLLETDLDWYLTDKYQLNLGIFLSQQTAKGAEYSGLPERGDLALFSSSKYTFNTKWIGTFSLRQAFSTDGTNPTTFSLGLAHQLSSNWNLSLELSRDFKQATFNDLYWDAPAAFSLLPETSWAQSLNVDFKREKHQFRASVFNINLKDRIVWLPQNGGIWRPENIASVWSRGIDLKQQSKYQLGEESQLKTSIDYQFVLSTNESDWFDLKGKQLIYTPKHSASFSLTYLYNRLSAVYTQNLKGKRYASRDNAVDQALPLYSIGQLSLAYRPSKIPFNVSLAVRNVWDVEYQTIAWRAMPGRHVNIRLKYNF